MNILQGDRLRYLQLMCREKNRFVPKGAFNTVLENVLSNVCVNSAQWIVQQIYILDKHKQETVTQNNEHRTCFTNAFL